MGELLGDMVRLHVNGAAILMISNDKSREIIKAALSKVLGYAVEVDMVKMKTEQDSELPELDL